MRRRDFITLIGAATAWPVAARAQQPGVPVIGYLSSRTAATDVPMLAAFREGLGSLGYVEGRNLAIEYRFADGEYERNRPLAEDLARRQVVLIVTAGNLTSALAAKAATATIPIVFNTGVDPVQAGLVSSINRPGGNATGVVSLTADLLGKMMELLHELVPNARTIAVIENPLDRSGIATDEGARRAAATLGLRVRELRAETDAEIEASFAKLAQERPDALLIPTTPLFLSRAGHIVELVGRLALPAIYGRRPFAEAGGLMSYGDDIVSGYRRMGVYAGRILKGEKPADLPVVLADKFELVLNLKTAKALGLNHPVIAPRHRGRGDRMIQRRDFITLLGGAAMLPVAARAQQPLPVVGHLGGASSEASQLHLAALREGLGEAGYVEGRNVTIEYRLADGQYDRLPALAADLVRRQVAVITAAGIPGAKAAKAATASIPIVFVFGEDPVKEGIVASLNRPGGNITGFSWLANQLIGKRLGLLTEIVSSAAVLAFLVDANNPVSDPDTREAQIAAGALRRRLEVLAVRSKLDFETAFTALVQRQVGGLALDVVPLFLDQREQVIALAARHGIPAIYAEHLFATAGGLMSYGPNQADSWRKAGVYAGRILKGEKPGDLPVQQSTKLELVINLKTAKSLGLDVPPALSAIADEVIE